MPTAEEQRDKMNHLGDKYDEQEPEPEGRFFDVPETMPKEPDLADASEVSKDELIVDASGNLYVPITPCIFDTSLSPRTRLPGPVPRPAPTALLKGPLAYRPQHSLLSLNREKITQ